MLQGKQDAVAGMPDTIEALCCNRVSCIVSSVYLGPSGPSEQLQINIIRKVALSTNKTHLSIRSETLEKCSILFKSKKGENIALALYFVLKFETDVGTLVAFVQAVRRNR